ADGAEPRSVPDPDFAVRAADGQPSAFGIVRESRHALIERRQRPERASGPRVPEPEPAALIAGSERRAVRTDRDGSDPGGHPDDGTDWLESRAAPQSHRAISC